MISKDSCAGGGEFWFGRKLPWAAESECSSGCARASVCGRVRNAGHIPVYSVIMRGYFQNLTKSEIACGVLAREGIPFWRTFSVERDLIWSWHSTDWQCFEFAGWQILDFLPTHRQGRRATFLHHWSKLRFVGWNWPLFAATSQVCLLYCQEMECLTRTYPREHLPSRSELARIELTPEAWQKTFNSHWPCCFQDCPAIDQSLSPQTIWYVGLDGGSISWGDEVV